MLKQIELYDMMIDHMEAVNGHIGQYIYWPAENITINEAISDAAKMIIWWSSGIKHAGENILFRRLIKAGK